MAGDEFRPFSRVEHGCVDGEPPPEWVRLLGALVAVVALVGFWAGVLLGWWP